MTRTPASGTVLPITTTVPVTAMPLTAVPATGVLVAELPMTGAPRGLVPAAEGLIAAPPAVSSVAVTAFARLRVMISGAALAPDTPRLLGLILSRLGFRSLDTFVRLRV